MFLTVQNIPENGKHMSCNSFVYSKFENLQVMKDLIHQKHWLYVMATISVRVKIEKNQE